MRNSIIIFLNRDLSFIKENKKAYIDRPLLVDENSINKLYQERISTYKQCLDIEIDTNSTILNTINEILTKLDERSSTKEETASLEKELNEIILKLAKMK